MKLILWRVLSSGTKVLADAQLSAECDAYPRGKICTWTPLYIWEVQAVNNAKFSYKGIGRYNLCANRHFFLLCQPDERRMKKLRSSQQQVHNAKPVRVAPPSQWVTPQTHQQHYQPAPDQKWITPETHGYFQDAGSQPIRTGLRLHLIGWRRKSPADSLYPQASSQARRWRRGLAQVLRVTLEVILVCLINAKGKQLNRILGQIQQEHTHGGECSAHYHRWILLLLLLLVRIVWDIR